MTYLADAEIRLFYKLWYELIYSVNQMKRVVPKFKKPVLGKKVEFHPLVDVIDKMWDNPQWIDEYLAAHDDGRLTESERGIIVSWRNGFIRGRFLVMKHYKKYTVFMPFVDNPDRLYGVVGISEPVAFVVPASVPFPATTTLLPFNGKIIYDSIILTSNVSFGRGYTEGFMASFNEIKKKYGIIESIDADGNAVITPPTQKSKDKVGENISPGRTNAEPRDVVASKHDEIGKIIERFCNEKFEAEHREEFCGICLFALKKLSRKRPSPLEGGKANTWAAGIVYAIGANNFIFDRSQKYYMSASEIAEWFNLSKSTAASKSSEVSKILKITHYCMPDYTFKSILDSFSFLRLL
jgi:hypothetical protein